MGFSRKYGVRPTVVPITAEMRIIRTRLSLLVFVLVRSGKTSLLERNGLETISSSVSMLSFGRPMACSCYRDVSYTMSE